jgi:hypothetical protein
MCAAACDIDFNESGRIVTPGANAGAALYEYETPPFVVVLVPIASCGAVPADSVIDEGTEIFLGDMVCCCAVDFDTES